MGYTSVSDVKNQLGQAIGYDDLGFSDQTSFDSYISTLISRAEDIVDRYCRVPDGFFESGGKTFSNLELPGDRLKSESGFWVLDTFSEWKAVYIDYSGVLQRAQIDTYKEE